MHWRPCRAVANKLCKFNGFKLGSSEEPMHVNYLFVVGGSRHLDVGWHVPCLRQCLSPATWAAHFTCSKGNRPKMDIVKTGGWSVGIVQSYILWAFPIHVCNRIKFCRYNLQLVAPDPPCFAIMPCPPGQETLHMRCSDGILLSSKINSVNIIWS